MPDSEKLLNAAAALFDRLEYLLTPEWHQLPDSDPRTTDLYLLRRREARKLFVQGLTELVDVLKDD
jgi:hypothetical protein